MGDVLAFAESREGSLHPAARETVSAARSVAEQLGGRVHVLVLGGPGTAEAAVDLARYGADRIHVAEDPRPEGERVQRPAVAIETGFGLRTAHQIIPGLGGHVGLSAGEILERGSRLIGRRHGAAFHSAA